MPLWHYSWLGSVGFKGKHTENLFGNLNYLCVSFDIKSKPIKRIYFDQYYVEQLRFSMEILRQILIKRSWQHCDVFTSKVIVNYLLIEFLRDIDIFWLVSNDCTELSKKDWLGHEIYKNQLSTHVFEILKYLQFFFLNRSNHTVNLLNIVILQLSNFSILKTLNKPHKNTLKG